MIIPEYWDLDVEITQPCYESIKMYIEKGCEPGSFITAIIENDLQRSVSSADHMNIKLIPEYVKFFQWYAPSKCWGYKGAVEDWIKILKDEKGVKEKNEHTSS